MESIEKTFAVVDRKVDRYTFTLQKVTGKNGVEYHIVDVSAPLADDIFEKHAITLACPKDAIKSIAADLISETNAAENGGTYMILRRITPAEPELIGGLLKKVEPKKLTLKPVTPAVRLTWVDVELDYDEREDEDDDYDEDEYFTYCPNCGHYLGENSSYHYCPYCGVNLV